MTENHAVYVKGASSGKISCGWTCKILALDVQKPGKLVSCQRILQDYPSDNKKPHDSAGTALRDFIGTVV